MKNKDHNWAIIVGAGKSKRFGKDKLFYTLSKPLIYYCLKAFNTLNLIEGIVLVTNKKNLKKSEILIHKYKLNKVKKIILGGEKRQDSVFQGLKTIPTSCNIICIHDGARPLITSKLIKNCIFAANKYQTCIPVIPIYDTLKEVKNNFIQKTLAREKYFFAQTPQCFKFNYFLNFANLAQKEKQYFTDEASILEHYHQKVFVISGEEQNIKITTSKDLKLFQTYLTPNSKAKT